MSPAWLQEATESGLAEQMPVSSPVHPVQLYVAVASLVVYAVLLWTHRRSSTPGWTTTAFCLLFPPTVAIDLAFRGDASLHVSLVVLCLAVLTVGIGMLIHLLDRRFVRKQFSVLHHVRGPVIVKCGWSWPAFLFPPCWAFGVRMWQAAFILLVMGAVVALIQTATGPLALLLAVPVNVFCGAKANAYRMKHLIKRGYRAGPAMVPSTYAHVVKGLSNTTETGGVEPQGAEPEN